MKNAKLKTLEEWYSDPDFWERYFHFLTAEEIRRIKAKLAKKQLQKIKSATKQLKDAPLQK
jgi:hypothetical protein